MRVFLRAFALRRRCKVFFVSLSRLTLEKKSQIPFAVSDSVCCPKLYYGGAVCN